MAWTNTAEPAALTWNEEGEEGGGFLQKEDSEFLLLESGGRIVLDRQSLTYTQPSEGADPTWTNDSEA